MSKEKLNLTVIEKRILENKIGAGNQTLYNICSGDKVLNRLTNSEKDIDILAAQMWLIGRSYAAQPERRYYGTKITLSNSGDGLDTFYDKMAKYLITEQRDNFIKLKNIIKELNEAEKYDKNFNKEERNLITLRKSIEAVLLFNDMAKEAVVDIDKADIKRKISIGMGYLKDIFCKIGKEEINIADKEFITKISNNFICKSQKTLDQNFLKIFIQALKEKTFNNLNDNNKKSSFQKYEKEIILKVNMQLSEPWDDDKIKQYNDLMFDKIKSKARNPYSFSSKFLHFHAPNAVFIKDSITHSNFSYGKDKSTNNFHFSFNDNGKVINSKIVIKKLDIDDYFKRKLGLEYIGEKRLYAMHCIKEYLLLKKIATEFDYQFGKDVYIPRQLDTYMLIANSNLTNTTEN